jgi:hypothetical protein
MTTSGFYGGVAETTGLYGNNPTYGGTYFEWYVFQVGSSQPATPTGGSWSFTTNSGIPPSGWSVSPPPNPTNLVWVSIALVDSRSAAALTWSTPGQFAYSSGAGLPILIDAGAPGVDYGQNNQLYIQNNTTPETVWVKDSGTWVQLTGNIYLTVAGGVSGGTF